MVRVYGSPSCFHPKPISYIWARELDFTAYWYPGIQLFARYCSIYGSLLWCIAGAVDVLSWVGIGHPATVSSNIVSFYGVNDNQPKLAPSWGASYETIHAAECCMMRRNTDILVSIIFFRLIYIIGVNLRPIVCLSAQGPDASGYRAPVCWMGLDGFFNLMLWGCRRYLTKAK